MKIFISVWFLYKNIVKIAGEGSFSYRNTAKVFGDASFSYKNMVKISGEGSFLYKIGMVSNIFVSFLYKNGTKIIGGGAFLVENRLQKLLRLIFVHLIHAHNTDRLLCPGPFLCNHLKFNKVPW